MSQLEVDKVIPQSGTTLTLGDSADTITIPSGATLDASNATLTLPDGSVTATKLASTAVDNTNTNSTVITGQTAETSIDGADSILIYDDSATALRKMTRTNFVAGIGGTNTPAFRAYMGSSQTIADVTNAVVQYNTENFDTDSAYDTATYRFTVPSDKAGKYFFGAHLFLTDAGNSIYSADMQIRKNGVNASADNLNVDSADYWQAIFKTTTILDLDVGDYVDVNVLANTNDGTSWLAYNTSPYQFAVFYGFKLL
jgi:hypothetical protein